MPSKCDYCLKKIPDYSIKCEQCEDIILCKKCFSFGVEAGKHKKCHKYSIQLCSGTKDFSLFDASWSAEQEMKLLQSVDSCGLGNWDDISTKVSRTALDCKMHYESVYGYSSSKLHLNYPRLLYNNSEKSSEMSCVNMHSYPKVPLDDCRKLGFMPKRDDFECEYKNEAETIVSKIRSEFLSDDLYQDLVVARVEAFIQCLRERQMRHVVAAKLDLVTHFLPDLLPSRDKVSIAMPTFRHRNPVMRHRRRSQFGRCQSRRRYSLIGSCCPFNLANNQSDIDVTRFKAKQRLVNVASRRRSGKLCLPRFTYSTRHKSESEDYQLDKKKSLESPKLIDEIPQQLSPTSLPETLDRVQCFAQDKNLVTEDCKLSSDFTDSGIGSSECSLHSTTSSLNIEGSVPSMSNPSPAELDTARQTTHVVPFVRRYSHPFISPTRIRSTSFSSVPEVIPQTCPPTGRLSTIVQTPRSSRGEKYSRIGRPRKVGLALEHSNLLPSNCCTFRSISDSLKPLLRFLTASEAKQLLSRLHREHTLRQEIEQLEHLQLSGNVIPTDNIRLAGNPVTTVDSDSDTEVQPSHRYKLLTPTRTLPRVSVTSHSLRSSELPKRGRPRGRPPLHRRRGGFVSRGTPKRLHSCTSNRSISNPHW